MIDLMTETVTLVNDHWVKIHLHLEKVQSVINYKHLSQFILSIVFKGFVYLLLLFARLLSRVRPFRNPGACRAPRFTGFPRQENCRTLLSPAFFRRSFRPRNQTCVSCIDRWILYHWTTWGSMMSTNWENLKLVRKWLPSMLKL